MPDELDIVGNLGSHVPAEKRTALERLERMGKDRAMRLLFLAMGDDRWRIRKAAIDALAEWENPKEAVKNLLGLLGENSDTVKRNSAVEVLTRYGRVATDYMLSALRDNDPHVRKLIVDVLGAVADPKAANHIIRTLSDEDENVRMAAAEALSNYKDSASVRALMRLLSGPDVPMRFYAMESLAKMSVSLPIEEIKPLVGQRILRRAALDALGNCPDPEAVALLIEGLHDASPSSRLAAVRSLGKLYGERVLLRNMIEKKLSSFEDKSQLLGALLEALDNSNVDIQRVAVRLMGALGHPDSVSLLIEAARDTRLQPDAVEALKRISQQSRGTILKTPLSASDPHPLRSIWSDVLEIQKTTTAQATAQKTFSTTTLTMTDTQFREFRDYLRKIYGIYFNEDMKFILERRLLGRLEALGMRDFDVYLKHVMSPGEDADEIGEAINILTTNETYFFREKFQLTAFQEEVLPELKMNNGASRRIRIWSAGCSSGEEAYTIAILVAESGLFNDGWDVQILGSDISNRMIRKALEGVYAASSFRETPERYLKTYFAARDANSYAVVDRIKRMVSFREINLANRNETLSAGTFDIIFCRNVIIYFDMDVKKKVIDHLYNVLTPSGYLLLGHSESLLNISTQFDLVHLKNDMIYRKPIPVEAER